MHAWVCSVFGTYFNPILSVQNHAKLDPNNSFLLCGYLVHRYSRTSFASVTLIQWIIISGLEKCGWSLFEGHFSVSYVHGWIQEACLQAAVTVACNLQLSKIISTIMHCMWILRIIHVQCAERAVKLMRFIGNHKHLVVVIVAFTTPQVADLTEHHDQSVLVHASKTINSNRVVTLIITHAIIHNHIFSYPCSVLSC